MKKLKLIPDTTNIKFAEKRVLCVSLSVIFIVASIVLYFTRGLNYGIDFEGGIMIEVKTEQTADLAQIRSALNSLDLGDVGIQTFGAPERRSDPRRKTVRRRRSPAGGRHQDQSQARRRHPRHTRLPAHGGRRAEGQRRTEAARASSP